MVRARANPTLSARDSRAKAANRRWTQPPARLLLNTTLTPFQPGTIFLDATRPFPIPADSFALVFGEHVIEHLEFDEAAAMLRECQRILRPGGRIRLATPDLAQIIALYTRPARRAAASLHPLDHGHIPPEDWRI